MIHNKFSSLQEIHRNPLKSFTLEEGFKSNLVKSLLSAFNSLGILSVMLANL